MRTCAVIMAAMLAAAGCGQPLGLSPALRSSDPQARCDAFYDLFGTGQDLEDNPRLKPLLGKSTKEIHRLLGKPSHVGTLDYRGLHYVEVLYRFDQCPSQAPPEERKAWEKGWRFGWSLVFRNGVLIPRAWMDDELQLVWYSMTPERLGFKPGGAFP
jgi:hypothetical protein